MLENTKELYGKRLTAVDGDIGHVKDFYFDDAAWAVRYVVVDTGSWLTGRLVLLSPHAFATLDQGKKTLRVNLRKEQIEGSPSIAAHETVSQQFEEQYYRSYGWPVYWQGGKMWGMSGDPLALSPQPQDAAVRKALEPIADRHLQSTLVVSTYDVQAVDGPIGHMANFHVNPRSWAIEELAVETGHWLSGKQILVSSNKVDRIDCIEKKVFVKLTRADIERTAEDSFATAGAGMLAADGFRA
jgi:hypothetical protein